MAKLISTWSKDPSTKVGALVVDDDGRLLTQGWNGLPRGVADFSHRLENKEMKYKLTVHAEMNCLLNAGYIGVSLCNSNMFVYGLPPCSDCAKGIIQSGVKRVFYCFEGKEGDDKWVESFKLTDHIFQETNIECTKIILP